MFRNSVNTTPPEAVTTAFKVGNLLIDMINFLLAYEQMLPEGFLRAIPRESIASCGQFGDAHYAPSLSCTCGFSAFTTYGQTAEYLASVMQNPPRYSAVKNLVLFQVQLSGPTVFSSESLRAAHQLITTVYLPGCRFCGTRAAFLSMNPAETMGLPDCHYLYPTCEEHANNFNGKFQIGEFARRNQVEFYSLV